MPSVQLVDFAAHLLNGHGIAFCVGDENTVLVDVGSAAQLVGDVADNRLVNIAAVLFACLHLAVNDLNQRLELEQIRAERRDRRTASALVQIVDAVHHKARLNLSCHGVAILLDFGG